MVKHNHFQINEPSIDFLHVRLGGHQQRFMVMELKDIFLSSLCWD